MRRVRDEEQPLQVQSCGSDGGVPGVFCGGDRGVAGGGSGVPV